MTTFNKNRFVRPRTQNSIRKLDYRTSRRKKKRTQFSFMELFSECLDLNF